MKKIFLLLLLNFIFSNIFLPPVFCANEYEDFTVAQQAFQDGFYDIAKIKLIKFLNDYPDSERKSHAFLLLGQCFYQTQNLHKAVLYLQKALKANAAEQIEDVIYFWLGELASRAKQFSTAISYYQEVIKEYPDSDYAFQSYDSLAKVYYIQGQYREAINEYEKMIDIYHGQSRIAFVLLKQAICWIDLKKYEKAKEKLVIFLNDYKTPDVKEVEDKAYYYLAECDYNLESYEEAIINYKKVLNVTKDERLRNLSNYGIGWCSLELSNYPKSIEHFNLVYDENFKYIDSVIFGVGKSFYKQGNYNKALKHYYQLVDKHKESEWLDDAYLDIVNILFELQRYKQALKVSQEAISLFRSTPLRNELIYNQGWIYIKLNNIIEAIKKFEQVMQTADGMLKIRSICRIGDIYFDEKKYDKAMDYYDIVLAQYPDSPYSYFAQYWLGMCLYNLGNYQGATIAFQTFLKNYPENHLISKVKFYLAESLFLNGQYKEAVDYFRQIASDYENEEVANKAFLQWGNSLYNAGLYKEALEVFKKLYQGNYPTDFKQMAGYQLGWCYYQLQEESKALETFEDFLSKYSDSDYSSDIIFWFGDYYYSNGKFSKAIDNYTKFIANYPQHQLYYNSIYWIAWSNFKLGNLEKSWENFNKVVSEAKDESLITDSKIRMSEVLFQQNKYNKATILLKDIIENSNNLYFKRLAMRTLGDLYSQRKEYELAINIYEEAKDKDENNDNWNGYLQFHIGLNYQRLQDLDKAVSEYLKVGYLYPDSTFWKMQGKLRTAEIFEKQGKWQKAVKLYQDLVKEISDASEYAKKRIRWIRNHKMR